MIGAEQPQSEDAADYAYVADLRMNEGQARPLELMPTVLELYERYLTRIKAMEGPVPFHFSDADQDILELNADYHKRRARFRLLRQAIRAAGPKGRWCPYCYHIAVSAIDHYLPKAHFGEYAIYAPNLVPICGKCNGIKLDRFQRDGGGRRRYLHPYFDQLPIDSTPYIAATLAVGTSIEITFYLVRHPEMTDELWDVLNHHFTDFGLAERYMDEAIREITSMLDALYIYFHRDGAEGVRDLLENLGHSKQVYWGRNHWWPVTLGVLAESQEFCNGGFKCLGPPDPQLASASNAREVAGSGTGQ